ncbi:MAG: peptide chain release factor N(5)-glutamine methyltransferase [Vulcanimicrobiaceae bacterium]
MNEPNFSPAKPRRHSERGMRDRERLVTVAQSLAHAIDRLAATSDSPRADAQLLLAYALAKGREWLIAHADDPLDVATADRFDGYVVRRSKGEPIAYILASAWFYGREFIVNHAVLVPRPQTEHLIDEALAHLRGTGQGVGARRAVLDVGLGSGAIACTIAAELPEALVAGTEISPAALEVAKANARRLGVEARCEFMLGDLLAPVPGRRFDAVLANLPYVPTADIAPAPDPVSFEPQSALDGGPDGLSLYRRLLPDLPRMLNPGGLVLLEAAPPTMPGLAELARRVFERADVCVRVDYANSERFVRVREA